MFLHYLACNLVKDSVSKYRAIFAQFMTMDQKDVGVMGYDFSAFVPLGRGSNVGSTENGRHASE